MCDTLAVKEKMDQYKDFCAINPSVIFSINAQVLKYCRIILICGLNVPIFGTRTYLVIWFGFPILGHIWYFNFSTFFLQTTHMAYSHVIMAYTCRPYSLN